jgi:hypothetical protein
MAIIINDNLAVNVGKPIDSKYLNGQTPWASIAAANTGVVLSYRYTGLTVNILGIEYWYADGVADINLVVKDSGIASTGLTTAINGLTKVGHAVRFGGTLSGSTVITDARTGSTAVGIQYGGDYCANFTARSLVDAAYVTGKTNVIDTIGSIGQIIYRDSTHLVGCANMIYCDSLPSFAFGASNTASGANSASIGGLSNIATAACSAIIAGQSNTIGSGNIGSVIIGGSNISLTASTNCCVVVVPNLSIWCTPSGSGNLLTWDSGTKKVCVTSVGASGGLTGATNGLSKNGQNVGLGGSLCCTTSITGNEALCLGINGNRLGSLDLWSFDDTSINARCILMSSSGATYTDLCAIPHGIQYGGDYSTCFCGNSLVSKKYVDSIATGLHIKTSVTLATTGAIALSTNQTIDGISTTTGMRILVKDQADATTNGIYSANTGSWGRTSDYNGIGTSGEVSNGDLIPVISGSTQNSSIWALVTPDPIIVGTTSLSYTEFSTVIDVQGGQGICITQVGGTHTVCVNATSGCGLAVGVGGLCINGSIGGNGLTYSGGIINVNACSCCAVAAINVGYNGSNNLVIACSDITSMSAIVTGATNGLTKNSKNVGLGGNLCCNTTIDITGSYFFNVCGISGLNFLDISDNSHCNGTDSHISLNSCCETNLWSCKSVNIGNCSSCNINITYCCAAIITDCTTSIPRGLQYAADYSATFVDRSLIDKAYVHCFVTGGTTVLTACNGLTKQVDNNVVLGGALTGTTTIGNSTCTLRINVDTLSLSGNTAFNLSTGCGVITDTGNNGGLKYAASYASCIVARSIPDAAWVTGCTNAIATNYLCNAENGLHKRGNNYVSLGGSLTGNTTIGAGIHDLKINVVNLNLTGSTAITLSGSTIKIGEPSAGTVSDAVLVWDSADSTVKTVAGSSLGDKNNIYSHSAVTTSVLLTTGSSYVILVNNSAPVTITLPASPLNGQVFKIKNVSGSAVTNIITVAGNGKNIDGSSSGAINTDYGALELMYDTTLTAWFSLAFIN